MQNDYLEILGLQPGATEQDIKRAYRALAKKYHPDVNRDEEARNHFIRIAEAYKFLTEVGPRPNYENLSYDYDPYQRQYEAWRERARSYARQQAREEAMNQQQLLLKIYHLFNYANIIILVLNLLIAIDYFLPPKSHQERIISISQLYQTNLNRSTEHINDQIVFRNFTLKVKKDATEGFTDDHATVYTTPILNFIRYADLNFGNSIKRLNPAYGIYYIFKFLIPVIICLGIIYLLMSNYHINKISIVVVMAIVFLIQLILIISFRY